MFSKKKVLYDSAQEWTPKETKTITISFICHIIFLSIFFSLAFIYGMFLFSRKMLTMPLPFYIGVFVSAVILTFGIFVRKYNNFRKGIKLYNDSLYIFGRKYSYADIEFVYFNSNPDPPWYRTFLPYITLGLITRRGIRPTKVMKKDIPNIRKFRNILEKKFVILATKTLGHLGCCHKISYSLPHLPISPSHYLFFLAPFKYLLVFSNLLASDSP